MHSDREKLVDALRSYQQGDAEGVMVLVSRQACDEAATALAEKDERIAALEAERDEARAECEGLRQTYVDANEALLDMERALIRVADATMPGLARRIAREALPIARAALSQKETGDAA